MNYYLSSLHLFEFGSLRSRHVGGSQNYQQLITQIYYNLPRCYMNDESKTVETTYGTLTYNGIQKIINKLQTFSFIDFNSDIFYDLGSGCGESLITFWLLTGMTSRGIELVPNRLHISEIAIDQIKQQLPNIPETPIAVRQGDITQPLYMDANIIYVSNLCLHEDTNRRLFEQIMRLPNIKAVIFSKEPTLSREKQSQMQKKFPNQIQIQADQSWEKDSYVYIYHI